ncbi:MAG TPA: hypothetical protein VHV75_09570 [Solirubrobacteraceae bacterium]|nr:hypothetical protein [Solirubrobacteraceae bacterium]
MDIEVDASVVLKLTVSEELASGDLVGGSEDVAQPEDQPERLDERLLGGLAKDRFA